MILQNILKYRNGSNFAHTLLSTIKRSGVNPPEKFFFLIMLTTTTTTTANLDQDDPYAQTGRIATTSTL